MSCNHYQFIFFLSVLLLVIHWRRSCINTTMVFLVSAVASQLSATSLYNHSLTSLQWYSFIISAQNLSCCDELRVWFSPVRICGIPCIQPIMIQSSIFHPYAKQYMYITLPILPVSTLQYSGTISRRLYVWFRKSNQ